MAEIRRQRLVVPDVVGLQWENAVAHLRNEGFVRSRVHYAEAYQAIDTVVSQVPLKGQIAASDEEVVLYVSKRSLVRFLPSVYQSTGSGTDPDFLRNFLWIFQSIFESVSQRVDRMHEQFSPYTADPEFLPWLAQWVSVSVDADWATVKKRKIIRSAAELYQRRGTAAAIRRLLEIFTDVTPEILENQWPYHGFWVGVHSTVGVDTVVLPPVNLAHCFVVRFPRSYEQLGEEMVARIHQVIQAEKPAHAVYFLEFAAEDVVVRPEVSESLPGLAPAPCVEAKAAGPTADRAAVVGAADSAAALAVAAAAAGATTAGAVEAPAPGTGPAAGVAAAEGTVVEGALAAGGPVAAVIEGEDGEAPVGMPMGIGIAAALAGEEGEAAVGFAEPEPAPEPAAGPVAGEDAGEGDEEEGGEDGEGEEPSAGASGDATSGVPAKRKKGKGKGKRRR